MTEATAETISKTALSSAKAHGLDFEVVMAVIRVESAFRPKAVRFEKSYLYLYKVEEFAKAHGVTVDSETVLQKFSYGPMQIMGATARELGFTGFLPDLCSVDLGVEWGCRYLAALKKKYPEENDYISAYNQGSPKKNTNQEYANQRYVDKILGVIQSKKKLNFLII